MCYYATRQDLLPFSKFLGFSFLSLVESDITHMLSSICCFRGGYIMASILIADPSEALCSKLTYKLAGHDIHICHTGVKAKELLRHIQPDVLIVNLCLPCGDGLSVIHHLSEKAYIIALTPIFSEEVFHAAASHGVDLLIPIPCSIEFLMDSINHRLTKIALF